MTGTMSSRPARLTLAAASLARTGSYSIVTRRAAGVAQAHADPDRAVALRGADLEGALASGRGDEHAQELAVLGGDRELAGVAALDLVEDRGDRRGTWPARRRRGRRDGGAAAGARGARARLRAGGSGGERQRERGDDQLSRRGSRSAIGIDDRASCSWRCAQRARHARATGRRGRPSPARPRSRRACRRRDRRCRSGRGPASSPAAARCAATRARWPTSYCGLASFQRCSAREHRQPADAQDRGQIGVGLRHQRVVAGLEDVGVEGAAGEGAQHAPSRAARGPAHFDDTHDTASRRVDSPRGTMKPMPLHGCATRSRG